MAEQESVDLWSTTALTNASSDPAVNFAEGQLPSTLNNSNRATMAAIARYTKDTNGSLTTAGSANAYTLTINGRQTPLATGHFLVFKASFSNTGAATLAVTNADAVALGAKAIRGPGDVALASGQMISGGVYTARYDTAANSAAGAWLLLDPSTSLNGIVGPVTFSVKKRSFTSSGTATYTATTGTRYVEIFAKGGGGAGGSVATTATGESQGGGGGEGGWSSIVLPVASATGKSYTVGAGGTPGATGNNAGGNGADTTFDTTVCVGKLGTGGAGAASGNSGSGGAGGVAGTGDQTQTGNNGSSGIGTSTNVTFYPAARGGFGAGQVNGRGGNGAVSYAGGPDAAGAAGEAGSLTILEYIIV